MDAQGRRSGLESAKALDFPLPYGAHRTDVTGDHRKGYGEDDFCSAIRVLEEWAGVR